MLTRRLLLTSTIFFTLFILQESLFSQIRLPLGGFSLFLIFTICWSALSTPEVGALTGFGAGLLLDRLRVLWRCGAVPRVGARACRQGQQVRAVDARRDVLQW